MKIGDGKLHIIHDSRGVATLETRLVAGEFWGGASVPSGKSRGSLEARVKDVHEAVKIFEKEVWPQIKEREFLYQDEFDNFLIKLDGTRDLSNLGGNLILALSLAFARLRAQAMGVSLYTYIANIYYGDTVKTLLSPRILVNVINGGVHTGKIKTGLDWQEFQLIPQHNSLEEGFGAVKRVYKKLGERLKDLKGEVSLGDEAGYVTNFKSNEEALSILKEVIREEVFQGVKFSFDIGIDAAANNFYKEGRYRLGQEEMAAEELDKYYEHLIHKYSLSVLEDPFYENDLASFAHLNKRKGIYIMGDDLTVTNPERIKLAINGGAVDGVIIKPNQIGTLTKTLEAAEMAHKSGLRLIVSHRSGETLDDFISDLAYGIGAWGIKAGAPETEVRLAKYRRLINIEREING